MKIYLLKIHTLNSNPVNAIAMDKSGVLWFGTNNGIFNWANNTPGAVYNPGLLNIAVKKIAIDFQNNIWFLHDNGLSKYNRSNIVQYSANTMGVAGAQLFDIAVDTLGNLWIGSSQGAVFFNGNTFQKIIPTTGVVIDNTILSVAIDRHNIKYFGTAKTGIFAFNGNSWKNFNQNNKVSTSRITNIAKNENSNFLWVAGDYGGISAIEIQPLTAYINEIPPICPGQSVMLNPNVYGGFNPTQYKYLWTSKNDNFSSSEKYPVVNPSKSTDYFLNVTDGFMTANAAIWVNVRTSSQIMGKQHVCSNTPTGSYSVVYTPNTNYLWGIQGGTILSDMNSNYIEVQWDISSGATKLFLTESDINAQCPERSQEYPVYIEMVSKPVIVRKGENLIICTDSGMMNYSWYLNQNQLVNAPNRQFLYLDKTQADIYGNYNVATVSKYGCQAYSDGIPVFKILSRIFPNPAKDMLKLEFNNQNSESGFAEIIDIKGNQIGDVFIPGKEGLCQLEIDVSRYSPGIYSYRIILGSNEYSRGKFIIK